MEENKYNFERATEPIDSSGQESVEQARFAGCLKILDEKVNIIAPFELKKDADVFKTYGIPESVILPESLGQYSAIFEEDTNTFLEWSPDQESAILHGEKKEFEDSSAIVYTALSVSEFIRQTNHRLLTHGASVELPNGNSIILLGNQGAGKTTVAYHLCKYHGCKMIGNDQVIFGLNNDNELETLGGTKNITIRQTATSGHLSELKGIFDENEKEEIKTTKWKTKAHRTLEELGIEASTQDNSNVTGIFWLNLDVNNQDTHHIKKLTPRDLIESLALSEKLSRHINGSATPVIGKSGQISLSPSFDTRTTLRNRQDIINKIYKTGYYSVSGGDLENILNDIKKSAQQ